jgi:Phage P22-like portal protein
MPTPNTKDAKFLKKARDRFRYCLESWRDIREEHDIDMRFLAGDQWDDIELRVRKDKHRPAIVLDELTQFVNQLVNDVRMNKRAVKVMPMGAGANDKTASTRADWIRAIEYSSQAQAAYITAFESGAGSSYGFWKLETFYPSSKSMNMSVRICPIVNANTIVFDPDCQHYDCSDAEDCFEVDFIAHDAFKQRWPDAEIAEFDDEIKQIAPEWIKDKQVQIASWWRVKKEKIQLHLVDIDDQEPVMMRSDELPENLDKGRILKSRDHEDRRIVQYVINGIEVLETNDPRDPKNPKGWPGNWIPIIPVWGKELFIDTGAGSKRILLSLIRLARDPQRLKNYYASQEMEEAKMTPRSPYMGPKGMFSNQWDQWADLNDTPKAAVEYETPDGYPPGSVKPERVPFVPNFQQYEMAKDAASRSIMTGMGISPLPTAAQRNNEKSGVALSKIQGERAQGSYHFIDNFDRSLEFSGRQLDDLFDKIHDTARDIPQRTESGQHSVARVNDTKSKLNREYKGEHDVTITTGPSYESQREEAADFSDTLMQIPELVPLIADLVVRLRNLGPIGDQIAERLTPPQFANEPGQPEVPPAAKAQIAQLTQQAQQLGQAVQQLNQEKAAKMWEQQGKLEIEKIHSDTSIAVAQIQTKAQLLDERLKAIENLMADFHGQAHEAATQAQDHANTMQQADQAHQQALAQGDQAHGQALEQNQQKAALEPNPDLGNTSGESGGQ